MFYFKSSKKKASLPWWIIMDDTSNSTLNELVRLLCYGSCQDPNMNAGWVCEFRIWTSCICSKSMNFNVYLKIVIFIYILWFKGQITYIWYNSVKDASYQRVFTQFPAKLEFEWANLILLSSNLCISKYHSNSVSAIKICSVWL